jgi:replication factor C subunit 3/5
MTLNPKALRDKSLLWVDKYRPTNLDTLDYHDNVTDILTRLAKMADLPHLIFYGPPGSGKRTRIMALLNSIFGEQVYKIKATQQSIFKVSKKTNKQKKVFDIDLLTSNYHIEINPSIYGFKDSLVIQQTIKEIATNMTFLSKFKVIVIHGVVDLSNQAQKALLRTMEKYGSNCRLILHCDNTSNIIEPLKSRCLGIRIALPQHEKIIDIMNAIINEEKPHLINSSNKAAFDDKLRRISLMSGRNLQAAIMLLERNIEEPVDSLIQLNSNLDVTLKQIANHILAIQNSHRLLDIREKLYDLVSHCIPAIVILKSLVDNLLDSIDDSIKCDVVKWAAHFDYQMKCGGRSSIFHLEAFLAKFMYIYKKSLLEQCYEETTE